jgi:hypothetical protein
MLDLHDLVLDPSLGERLAQPVYKRDYRKHYAAIDGRDSWKFERRQHFEELNDPSREALRQGDWEASMRLNDAERDDVLAALRRDERLRTVFHRVRVVEEPLTPYMQWELYALRLRVEWGMKIRALPREKIAALEGDGLLPEVVILGGQTLYNILYTDTGVPDGAIRFTDPGVVGRWERFIKGLYEDDDGEDMWVYYDRAVAHLPPPGPS